MIKSEIVLRQIYDFIEMTTNKVVWLLSITLTTLLSALGYPKEILVFIVTLIIVDVLTKHYSIVVLNYGSFGIKNYFKAWRERFLTSRGMKNGIGVKVILYLPVLYIAHKSSIIPELIYGTTISNVLYSLLVIIESRSVLENLEDSGMERFKVITNFIKRKEKELTDKYNDKGGGAVG